MIIVIIVSTILALVVIGPVAIIAVLRCKYTNICRKGSAEVCKNTDGLYVQCERGNSNIS